MTKPQIEPALLSANDAATYLGVSRRYFEEQVRPFVSVVDMKAPTSTQPMPRYAREDLDAFWRARRKDRKAS